MDYRDFGLYGNVASISISIELAVAPIARSPGIQH
jgi:hypothetical protein